MGENVKKRGDTDGSCAGPDGAIQAQSSNSPWSIAGSLGTILTTVGGIILFVYDHRTKKFRKLVVKGWSAVRKRCARETIEHGE